MPQLRKHIPLKEFPFVAANKENLDWSEKDLRAKICELGPWTYDLSFSYGLTTRLNSIYSDGTVDFHRFRTKLVSETIIDLLGDEVGQSTVLDLACHCGVFTLDVAHRGAGLVQGIEFRQKNLDQAKFLKKLMMPLI